MNIFQKLKLAKKLSSSADEFEEGIKMKNVTKIVAAVVTAAVAIITASPDIQHGLVQGVSAHPAVSSIVTGLITILTLLHDPKQPQTPQGGTQ